MDIKQLGEQDYIAPAVRKGNKGLLDWLNTETDALTKEDSLKKRIKQPWRLFMEIKLIQKQ